MQKQILPKLIANFTNFQKFSHRNFNLTKITLENVKVKPKLNLNKFDNKILLNEKYNFNYVQLKLNDKYLSNLMLLIRSKKHRPDQIVVEGKNLIREAIQNQFNLTHILFSKVENLEPILDDIRSIKSAEIVKVPQHDLKTYSVLTTCPGVIAVFDKKDVKENPKSLPLTVICDNIREPNNLGSIIRVAKAVDCRKVVLTKGCVDPWDTKCLRGSAGSIFSMKVTNPVDWSVLHTYLEDQNEDALIYVADNNIQKYSPADIVPYHEAQTSNHVYVIIGGETHGISQDALKLAHRFKNFKCLHIPMAQNIESLNTACALSVLLFELRRKFLSEIKVTAEIAK